MKKGDFGNQQAGRQMKGDNWRGGDFGNQHAGRQRKGDKWRGGDFGNQHAGRQMKEDKWRREILEISMQGDKWRETNEEGRLGAAAISVISMQGDKWRRETRSGSDFGNQHAGRQMKGDKWRRETRSGSDFGNQQPNLWEVRTPIASSYLGKKWTIRFSKLHMVFPCMSCVVQPLCYLDPLPTTKEHEPVANI